MWSWHSICQNSDGFPLSFDWSANASQFVEGFVHVFQAHVDDFIENLVLSKPNPPISCIIADSFHVWGSTIAKKYNLVNVSFWTEPATVLTVYYHMDLLKSNGHFGCHGMNQISWSYYCLITAFIYSRCWSKHRDAPFCVQVSWRCTESRLCHR